MVEGGFETLLPGAATSMPILTGTRGGKNDRRSMAHLSLIQGIRNLHCAVIALQAHQRNAGLSERASIDQSENPRVTTTIRFCREFTYSMPALIHFSTCPAPHKIVLTPKRTGQNLVPFKTWVLKQRLQPRRAILMIAAALRSTSSSVVAQLDTLMRIAACPCHCVPPHQHVPSR
jgi:hypothetical protein